jgi:predicted RNA-binding protein with PIN domain
LRQLVNFRRLPKTALDTVASVVHGDAEFREQLLSQVTEANVGRAAIIWLRRSSDWMEQLGAYVDEDAVEASAFPDARVLQRKLRGAERAAAREEELRVAAEAETERQRERADTHRSDLRAAQRERDAARREAKALTTEIDELRSQLTRTEQTLSRRDDERRRLRDRVRELEEIVRGPLNVRETRELQRLARAVTASARAAAADAEALERELGDRLSATPKVVAEITRPARRRPVRMPSGIVDDSVAGAEHLVTRPGAVLIVDGYNATLSSWPDLALEHQRDRLVAMLSDLTARVAGLEAYVVFDGAEGMTSPSRRRRSAVQLQFSPADVEADDVVLALIDDLPADRVVVVASNDRRVRDGARLAGANVISVNQLIALVR